MIMESHAWPSFATELERIKTLQICFLDFWISGFQDYSYSTNAKLYFRLFSLDYEVFLKIYVLLVVLLQSGYLNHTKFE